MQAPMTIKQYVSQMRKIPGGRFTMGRTYDIEDKSGLYKNEIPTRLIDISSFDLGATLVTVGMWREYLRANKQLSMPMLPRWGWIDDHPMINVSWNDIMGDDGAGGYCAWASRVSGVKLILPTEAQWEYAAKGGQRNLKFPWGDTYDSTKVWGFTSAYTGTAPVGRNNNIHSNDFGLEDLAGNAYQWCFDAFIPYVPQKRDRLGYPLIATNPIVVGTGPFSKRKRMLRGSSWLNYGPDSFRCVIRTAIAPSEDLEIYGFRLSARPK